METYQLTLEDWAYLIQNEPENFSDPDVALQRVEEAMENGRSGKTLKRDLSIDYSKHGADKPNKSPIPEATEDSDVALDCDFSSASCDCGSETPCCFQEGIIEDRDVQSGRRLKWPVGENDPTTMLVIASETGKVTRYDGVEVDTGLIGRLDITVKGNDCKESNKNYPALFSSSNFYGDMEEKINKYQSTQYVAIPLEEDPRIAMALSNPVIPHEYLMVFYLLSGLGKLIYQRSSSEAQVYKYTPKQCVNNVCIYPTFKIIPVPNFNLKGNLGFAFEYIIKTDRIYKKFNGQFGVECTYGKYQMSHTEKPIDHTWPKDEQYEKSSSSESKKGSWPGPLKYLKTLISEGELFIGKYKVKKKENYIEEYGARICLFVKSDVETNGISLEPKKNSPDLLLNLGGFSTKIILGIELRVDLISFLLSAFAYVSAGQTLKIEQARQRMAQGIKLSRENSDGGSDTVFSFNAIAIANLTGVGQGEQIWQMERNNQLTQASITIPADKGIDIEFNRDVVQRRNARIIGKLDIKAQLNAEVWIFSGEASAEGFAHTEVTWEWKQDKNGEWWRRFYFGGLTVGYRTKFQISSRGDNNGETDIDIYADGNSDYWEEAASEQDIEKYGGKRPLTIEEKIARLQADVNSALETVGVLDSDDAPAWCNEDRCGDLAEEYDDILPLCEPSVRNKNESKPEWQKDDNPPWESWWEKK